MQKLLLAVFAIVLLLGAASLAFFLGTERSSPPPSPTSEPAVASPTPVEAGAPAAPVELPETKPAPEASTSAAATREVVAQRIGDWESEDERILEGRVVLSGVAPADETLRVLGFTANVGDEDLRGRNGVLRELAAGEDAPGSLAAIAQVAPDGTFRIALPANLERGWLTVDGRYLYMSAPRAVELGSANDVTLVPEVGAWVHGRVLLPDGIDAQTVFDDLEVRFGTDVNQFEVMGGARPGGFGRACDVDDNGAFELRALTVGRRYALEVEHDDLANYRESGIEPTAGEELVLSLHMRHGGTIRGRVEGPDGAAVAGADVAAVNEFVFGFPASQAAECETDEAGDFELRGVPTGEVSLFATADGFLSSEPLETSVEDGAVLEGVTMRLDAGASIAGRVIDSSGDAVEGAEIRVSFDPAAMMGMAAFNAARGAEGSAESAADGRFEVTGLGKGPFLVRARAELEEGVDWHAEIAAVSPDTRDLELVLEKPSTLRGVVVDQAGRPVEQYTLQLGVVSQSGPFAGLAAGNSRSEAIEAEDGTFAIEGLRKGRWRIEARAAGYGPSPHVEVELPNEERARHSIVLPPSASVIGRVVAPNGTPVTGAQVTLDVEPGDLVSVARGDIELPKAVSGEEGEFALDGLGGGSIGLVATHPDWAGSESVVVDVPEGGAVEGVELVLRAGGSVRGLLYGKDGEPEGGTRVIFQQQLTLTTRFVTTEPDGSFLAKRLRPGGWQVTAFLSGSSFGTPTGGDEGDLSAMFENLRFTMVEVKDGEESEVVLGAPPADPVHVSGSVTVDGEPAGPGILSFTPAGAEGMQSLKIAQVGRGGRYDVDLDHAGDYHLQMQFVSESATAQQTIEFNETVPESEEHVIDLELPVGGIQGTVQGPDGRPLANARVSLITEGAVRTGTFLGGQFAELVTDAEGRYEFLYLRPGVYSVAAGGATFGGAFGTTSTHGRTIHDGIRVAEDEIVTGIDFRLERAGNIHGVVRDAMGKPVASASVFVRDERGRLLERFSMTTTGGDGQYTYAGVAPGEYSVTARSNAMASSEGRWTDVSPGETAELDLVVDPGTTLLVEVVDQSDADVSALVSVLDEDGREMNGMLGFSQIMARMSEGFEARVQKIGPLPAGRYTVEVRADDGRTAKKPVSVDGRPERKVKIRLR